MPRHRTDATKSPPRLMIEVTPRQWDIFKKRLPYGFQKQVFGAIIEDMCQMWAEFGDDFTRAMLQKNLSYGQFMKDYIERNNGKSKRPTEAPIPKDDLGGTNGIHQGDSAPKEEES